MSKCWLVFDKDLSAEVGRIELPCDTEIKAFAQRNKMTYLAAIRHLTQMAIEKVADNAATKE